MKVNAISYLTRLSLMGFEKLKKLSIYDVLWPKVLILYKKGSCSSFLKNQSLDQGLLVWTLYFYVYFKK